MSGTHLKGTHEVVTKGVDPTQCMCVNYVGMNCMI